ncbi:MAG: hypothetical protein LBB98_11735 [Treponema sp.]|jgi:hypothetical protein|nr:hypothetical protein [Treponema sp.]
MKKFYAIIVVLLVGAASLWAELPPRIFEFGFKTGAGFANSYIGATEIFKKTIEIDLTQEPKPLYFDFGADFDFFININIKDKMGFGLFSGLDAQGQFGLSEDIQKFLLGNEHNKTYEGDIGAGGAVFMEVGVHGYFHVEKFKITVRPAYYFPAAYMKPNSHYKLVTSETGEVYADFEYDFALYTPFDLGDDLDSLNFNNLDPSNIAGRGGVDLVAAVDYQIFPKLSVGASVSHIPIFPAQLVNKTVIKGGKHLESDDLINELIDGGDIESLLKDKTVDSSHDAIQIFRPFKFGINAAYTPFGFKVFSLSLIPQIGYAYNAIYVKPHSFEGTLKIRLGLFNIIRSNPLLAFTLSTGYEDKVWRHGIDFALNLRAMQLDVGAAVQSENFVNSFKGAGVDVSVGLRFGW